MSTTDSSKTRTAQPTSEDTADKRDSTATEHNDGISTQENHSSSEPAP